MASPGSKRVDLLRAVELVHEHLTAALCQDVYRKHRVRERERVWTLARLAEFWSQVALRAPESLTQVLQEPRPGSESGAAVPSPSPQGFFARCQKLRPEFLRDVHVAFTQRLLAHRSPAFARALHPLLERFTGLRALDGSRLDAIAHRLKILWNNRAVILPGAVVAHYDLVFGVVRYLEFDPDAAASELKRAERSLDGVPKGTLFVADRLYGNAEFFAELSGRGLFGVVRYNRTLGLHGVRVLSRRRVDGGVLEDRLVVAGSGQKTPPQTLRYVCWRSGRTKRALLTNVLEPERLSAAEALDLYPFRWQVERLFFDLKQVLDLHHFYAANPNAIAMQVYGAAIVHTALRIAQAEIARDAHLEPEELSVPKLFPRIATASAAAAGAELMFAAVKRAHPRMRIRKPDMHQLPFASTTLAAIRVQKRRGPRRKRRYCKARRKWKRFPGSRKVRS